MRFLKLIVKHFKLLEDITVEFSTDPQKPLTMIRAENGSGKTSLLWALQWAFYGSEGLPSGSRDLRLTSSALPKDTPVEVQVTVDFEHGDDEGTSEYRLIRTVQETPKGEDKFDRGPTKLRLLSRTAAGFEDVKGDAEAAVRRFLPMRLRRVFFTDGDDVQRFISGETAHGRQKNVHEAIKALLGLDELHLAKKDLESTSSKLRSEAAKTGGAKLGALEAQLADLSEELDEKREKLDSLHEERRNILSQKEGWNKELSDLKGIGHIDELNARIKELQRVREHLESNETVTLVEMRALMASEIASWSLATEKLSGGFQLLDELADRGVIPSASIEVLTDRLELHECICGADLSPGTESRSRVEELREQQKNISETRKRQTQTFHAARIAKAAYEASLEDSADFDSRRRKLLSRFRDNREQLRDTGEKLTKTKAKRARIDEERVRTLSDRIENAEGKLKDTSETIGALDREVQQTQERQAVLKVEYEKQEKAAKVSNKLRYQRQVADDLTAALERTLHTLENEHLEQVSQRMNQIFLEIVGSDPERAGAVFRRVELTKDFDIRVETAGDGHLDPDFEINGASRRALTLSFIWALMEASDAVVPRVIDTPLGMTAGGVKKRLVESITEPPAAEVPKFQVVLLLTRSEIRDIEGILAERAGSSMTLSCNKDYPADLVHDWPIDRPLIRLCHCTHLEFCEVCERQYDSDHGLVARQG